MIWTLSDPSEVIGTAVGGNRYGWFATDEFPFLAFDTSALIGYQDYCEAPPSTPGAKVTAGGWIPRGDDKATFGLTAKATSATAASGQLTYQDHDQDRTVISTEVSTVILNGNCAQVLGRAKVNGTASLDFGDGAPPLPGVAFTVIAGADGVVLTIDSTPLPAAGLTAGAITVE